MKINEVVTAHPALKRSEDFARLMKSNDDSGIIEFIMDDNNAEGRRLALLKRLDALVGTVQSSYNKDDLDNFMHDQSGGTWQDRLRKELEKFSAENDSYSFSHNKEYPPGTTWDFSNVDNMSDEEMIQLAKDLKIPPYHLSVVDEQFDDETPTGEYEICQRCGGEGCIECEEGLKDITGLHKVPNFDDYQGE